MEKKSLDKERSAEIAKRINNTYPQVYEKTLDKYNPI